MSDIPALPAGPVLIAPLFLLYDYSFRPPHVSAEQVLRWASVTNSVCSDEILLHPDPFPERGIGAYLHEVTLALP